MIQILNVQLKVTCNWIIELHYVFILCVRTHRNSFIKCDFLVLHCASLLRTIFASLARAHERARVQNVRDFPQTKFDSEINAPFLLNEHGDPHFFHNFNENNILNNWEKN